KDHQIEARVAHRAMRSHWIDLHLRLPSARSSARTTCPFFGPVRNTKRSSGAGGLSADPTRTPLNHSRIYAARCLSDCSSTVVAVSSSPFSYLSANLSMLSAHILSIET